MPFNFMVITYDNEDKVPTPYAISQIIDPCGDGAGFDEVLLKLENGNILAYVETSTYRFLSVLPPGLYTTTDQQKCRFTIDSSFNVKF